MKRQLWGETQMAAGRDRSIRPRDESAALARIPKPTLRFSAPLSATSATALDRLWEAMLARVEEPAEPVRCIDGTSYSVFQWHEKTGSRGGWGQCPGSGSPPAALLELLEELRKAARSSGTALMQEDMHIAVTATQLLREVR